MAQFVFADLAHRAGLDGSIVVDSAATSREEIGEPPHPGTVRELRAHGVPIGKHRARQVRRDEYDDWDMFIYMDGENERGLMRIFGGDPESKCAALLSFAGLSRDVADPWYTGDFGTTYRDIAMGCAALLEAMR